MIRLLRNTKYSSSPVVLLLMLLCPSPLSNLLRVLSLRSSDVIYPSRGLFLSIPEFPTASQRLHPPSRLPLTPSPPTSLHLNITFSSAARNTQHVGQSESGTIPTYQVMGALDFPRFSFLFPTVTRHLSPSYYLEKDRKAPAPQNFLHRCTRGSLRRWNQPILCNEGLHLEATLDRTAE